MKDMPPIQESLVKALKERFPDKAPSLGDAHDTILFKAGQVDVVRFLENTFKQQQEE